MKKPIKKKSIRKKPTKSRACSFSVLCIVFLNTIGCTPQVTEFAAQPQDICTGTPVIIRWQVKGNAVLSSQPLIADAALGVVPASGSITVVPKKTTLFHLDVKRGFKSTAAEQEVKVIDSDSAPKTIGQSLADPSAGCDQTSVWVTDNATHWDPKLRVVRVVSHDGRRYHIEHQGHSGDVSATVPSTAFSGTSVKGKWLLKMELKHGEACGTASIPRSLMVDVYTACEPGGAQ
jgi:hypothetical protein